MAPGTVQMVAAGAGARGGMNGSGTVGVQGSFLVAFLFLFPVRLFARCCCVAAVVRVVLMRGKDDWTELVGCKNERGRHHPSARVFRACCSLTCQRLSVSWVLCRLHVMLLFRDI